MLQRQFMRFVAVGAIGTAAHYAVLIALVSAAIARPAIAASGGFAVGAVTNYVLNYHFTFSSERAHLHAFPRFLLIAASGGVINYALVQTGVGTLHWHYLLAQIAATAIVLLWTFTLNRVWTFAPALDRKQPSSDARSCASSRASSRTRNG